MRECLRYDACAAVAEVLTPGEHDQIDAIRVGDRDDVVGGEPEPALQADSIVRDGDVARQELALPRRCRVQFVIGERRHRGWRVDVQDADLQLPPMCEPDRILERLRAVAGTFERHEDTDELRARVGVGWNDSDWLAHAGHDLERRVARGLGTSLDPARAEHERNDFGVCGGRDGSVRLASR